MKKRTPHFGKTICDIAQTDEAQLYTQQVNEYIIQVFVHTNPHTIPLGAE